MSATKPPIAIDAHRAPPRAKASHYPEPFASRMAGRVVRPLGDAFGLANFGVNLATLAPGAVSALRHAHTRQDEFVYVLAGEPTLVTDAGEEDLNTLLELTERYCVVYQTLLGSLGLSAVWERAAS